MRNREVRKLLAASDFNTSLRKSHRLAAWRSINQTGNNTGWQSESARPEAINQIEGGGEGETHYTRGQTTFQQTAGNHKTGKPQQAQSAPQHDRSRATDSTPAACHCKTGNNRPGPLPRMPAPRRCQRWRIATIR